MLSCLPHGVVPRKLFYFAHAFPVPLCSGSLTERLPPQLPVTDLTPAGPLEASRVPVERSDQGSKEMQEEMKHHPHCVDAAGRGRSLSGGGAKTKKTFFK